MPLLNLPHYSSTIIEETDHDIHIELKPKELVKRCRLCNSNKIQSFGKRPRHYMDIPIRGKRVGLNIDVQRFRCKECGKTFTQALPEMSEQYKMSERLEQFIKKHSILRPYAHIAKEVGVADATVYNLFSDHITDLSKRFVFETPTVMGIDEIHLAKQPRCVITNIEQRTIIEMLKDRNKPTVKQYLSKVKNPQVILNVAMDMWKPYKDAVQDVVPHAKIVIDKFHVVRMANLAVEKCRKEMRTNLAPAQRKDLKNDRFILLRRESELNPRQQLILSHWRLNYPILGKVYDLKEAFYAIYNAKSKQEAYQRYEKWESGLESDVLPYYADLHRAITNWYKEIFSYFDYPITNAYTESLNSVIRHIDRIGRSYGFESIRAKILYASNLHANKVKPKFNKSHKRARADDAMYMSKMPPNVLFQEANTQMEEANYGVSLDKLAKMLESGELEFEV